MIVRRLQRNTFSTVVSSLLAWFGTVSMYAQQSVLTWHNDNGRTGQYLGETTLTTTNVNSSTFGKLFVISVTGKVDAQPLYVPSVNIPGQGTHNVLYVATEHDLIYAFDADNGASLWNTAGVPGISLVGTLESSSDDRNCGQVTPEIGITATPVIDPASGPHGTIYVVTMTKDKNGAYHHRLHALDLTTGAEEFGGPTEVTASVSGAGITGSGAEDTFLPAQHKDRPGLLLLNGVVYTTWGSHCDAGPYTGWVIGYDETTLQKVSTLNLTPNGNDGGIWNAGAGPAADANSNIFLLTGNGTFDNTLDGQSFPQHGDFGNAFVRILTSPTTMTVKDYFTMFNTTNESNADADLGSGGLILLPPLTGKNATTVNLAVGAGKDGNMYVVDTANMGKFNSTSDAAIYQQLTGALPGGVWSSPAWFNGTLYYGSVNSTLKAFTFTNGLFGVNPTSQSPTTFGYPATTPSISANGTSNAIVWAAENSSPATLHAYDATNVSHELYNSNQAANSRDNFGNGNKYIVPTIANGKVYVGTTSGVGVFGILPTPPAAPVLTAPANLATGVTVPPTLTWTAAANAVSYDVYLGTASTPPLVTNVTGTTYTPATLLGNTQYFWRIVAKNAGGSASSPTWSFTDATAPPTVPALTSPANASTNQPTDLSLSWQSATGAVSYDVYFGTASSPPLLANTTATTYVSGGLSGGQLISGTQYFWRIVAKNAVGSTSSATWSFTTTGTAPVGPSAPLLTSPANGSTGQSLTPALVWQTATGATSYDVYFGTAATPPLVTNVTGTTYSPGTLIASTLYHWQIVAKNANGTAASANWSFTTMATAPSGPATPVLTSPGNGSTGQALTPALVWQSASGATSYDVHFGTAATPPLVTNVTGTTYSPAVLTAGTMYHWQIVAKNSTGTASSATWSFTTAAQSSGNATMASPTPGTQLPSTAVTFSWAAVTGADQYWVDVGSRMAVGDYFAQATTSTSLPVSSAPCDGRTVFVQLFTHIQGAWQTPNQYTYTAATGCAALSAPAANSTFAGTSQVFSWAAVSGADQYWLDVGNGPRRGDIFGAATTGTSDSVTGIPCDGRLIYVQLWTHKSGVWQNPGEYLYTAAPTCGGGGGGGGGGSSPAPGSTLTSPSQTFSWSAVTGADQYWLDVGSRLANGDYFASATTSTSLTVNSIPCDGRTVFVQEWVHMGGVWQTPTQLTFTAPTGCAVLTAPANGSTFTDTTVNFTFNAITGADQYWLDVGNVVGHGDIFGAATMTTSVSVPNVPCDGRTIYAQLWTHKNGVWQNPGRYQFTAWGACGGVTHPVPSTTLTGSNVTFNWTPGTGVTAFWLDVGTVVGQGNIFGANVGTSLSQAVTGIPTNGSPIFVQLWSQIGGVWRLNRYTYTAF
jgi:hypothetical protein